MDLDQLLHDPNAHWQRAQPAEEKAVDLFLHDSQLALPPEYLALLRYSNGGSGVLKLEPGWFELWPIEDVLVANQAYDIHHFLPGFFGFGSSGGGELLAFDTRTAHPWTIYRIPFIPLNEAAAVAIAPDFRMFIQAMGRSLGDVTGNELHIDKTPDSDQ